MLHYLDYRETHDVDAWWHESTSAAEKDRIVEIVRETLTAVGEVRVRRTVNEIRRPEWRPAVDACRLLTSPVYHLLRKWHDLPELPYLGDDIPYIRDDPSLAYV